MLAQSVEQQRDSETQDIDHDAEEDIDASDMDDLDAAIAASMMGLGSDEADGDEIGEAVEGSSADAPAASNASEVSNTADDRFAESTVDASDAPSSTQSTPPSGSDAQGGSAIGWGMRDPADDADDAASDSEILPGGAAAVEQHTLGARETTTEPTGAGDGAAAVEQGQGSSGNGAEAILPRVAIHIPPVMEYEEAMAMINISGAHGGNEEMLHVMAQSLVDQSIAEHAAALARQEALAPGDHSDAVSSEGTAPSSLRSSSATDADPRSKQATSGGEAAPAVTKERIAQISDFIVASGRVDRMYDTWSHEMDEELVLFLSDLCDEVIIV